MYNILSHIFIDTKTSINSIGLLLTIIGTFVVYKNSPLNTSNIDGGNASSNYETEKYKVNQKNKYAIYGVRLIVAGTALQLVSNYIRT